MLATRAVHTTDRESIYNPPTVAIDITPPSPSLHATYLSCEASEADESFNLPTPTDSDFSHEGLKDGGVHIRVNSSATNMFMDYFPSRDFASKKAYPTAGRDVDADMSALFINVLYVFVRLNQCRRVSCATTITNGRERR